MNSIEEHQKFIQSQGKKKYAETNTIEYNSNTEQNIDSYTISIPKFDILKPSNKILSPMIFIKRKYKTKTDSKSHRRIAVLENMLSTVVQAYYKSDYEIESVMRILKSVGVEVNLEEPKPNGLVRRTYRKQGVANQKGKNDTDDNQIDQNEPNQFMEGFDALEYLVSPLKFDFEFGKLIRKLVA